MSPAPAQVLNCQQRLGLIMERAAEAARAGDLLWFSNLPADQLAPLLQVFARAFFCFL